MKDKSFKPRFVAKAIFDHKARFARPRAAAFVMSHPDFAGRKAASPPKRLAKSSCSS